MSSAGITKNVVQVYDGDSTSAPLLANLHGSQLPVCPCVYARLCPCVCMCTHTYPCMHLCPCVHSSQYVCAPVCRCACRCVCIHVACAPVLHACRVPSRLRAARCSSGTLSNRRMHACAHARACTHAPTHPRMLTNKLLVRHTPVHAETNINANMHAYMYA